MEEVLERLKEVEQKKMEEWMGQEVQVKRMDGMQEEEMRGGVKERLEEEQRFTVCWLAFKQSTEQMAAGHKEQPQEDCLTSSCSFPCGPECEGRGSSSISSSINPQLPCIFPRKPGKLTKTSSAELLPGAIKEDHNRRIRLCASGSVPVICCVCSRAFLLRHPLSDGDIVELLSNMSNKKVRNKACFLATHTIIKGPSLVQVLENPPLSEAPSWP
ncbi:hypothetical protein DNTS_020338 [Danionella cerebrum]|uniref:Uncharacterized protein n=1 Tax=Danionella cerebrum TaxID=2873325 RepID=A0A553R4T5_9TELE|nr:hypothetical protein DNTS_020338 [Danionella translucida]